MEKQCTKCKEFKNTETYFYKDSQKRDGYRSICKKCTSLDRLERRKDPEKLASDRSAAVKSQNKKRDENPLDYRAYYNRIRREKYHSDPIHRQKIVKRSSDRKTKLRREDPVQRAIDNARNRAKLLFGRKTNSYSKFIGCTRDEFKAHIEGLFQSGMTWDNYGEWHIDHKFPLSIAYQQGEEAFSRACLYLNLQPLWASDNIKKGSKVE